MRDIGSKFIRRATQNYQWQLGPSKVDSKLFFFFIDKSPKKRSDVAQHRLWHSARLFFKICGERTMWQSG